MVLSLLLRWRGVPLRLQTIHHFVEILDRYFGNVRVGRGCRACAIRAAAQVCELDLIYNFHRAHFVLDELIIGGEVCRRAVRVSRAVVHRARGAQLVESSKKSVLRVAGQQDQVLWRRCVRVCVRVCDGVRSLQMADEPPDGSKPIEI